MKKELVLKPTTPSPATTEGSLAVNGIAHFTLPTPCTFSLSVRNLSNEETWMEVLVGSSNSSSELSAKVALLPHEVKTIILPQSVGTSVTITASNPVSILEALQHIPSSQQYGAGGVAYTLSAGARDYRDSSISLASGSSLVLHKLEEFGEARVSLITQAKLKAQLDGIDYYLQGIVTFHLDSTDFNSLFLVAETSCTIRFSLATTPPANYRQQGGTLFSWNI